MRLYRVTRFNKAVRVIIRYSNNTCSALLRYTSNKPYYHCEIIGLLEIRRALFPNLSSRFRFESFLSSPFFSLIRSSDFSQPKKEAILSRCSARSRIRTNTMPLSPSLRINLPPCFISFARINR